jgi:hypothetical protein
LQPFRLEKNRKEKIFLGIRGRGIGSWDERNKKD